jgi:hypothetical protein
LKPYPQHTERSWEYDNIDEKGYYRQYNFTLKNHTSDKYRDLRIGAMKEAFVMCKNALILGSGDKENKKAFFQMIYPSIKFEEIVLSEKLKIYFSRYPKIILSNYYDNRSGIRLDGLKCLYNFIIDNSLH